MSTRPSPGGRFMDEMRLIEALDRMFERERSRDRRKLEKAEQLMDEEMYQLFVASDACAYVGAKMPMTPEKMRRVLKEAHRLKLKAKYLSKEQFEDRQKKFRSLIDEVMFRSKRERERVEVLPEIYDGHAEAKEEVGWFGRVVQGAKRIVTGEGGGGGTQ